MKQIFYIISVILFLNLQLTMSAVISSGSEKATDLFNAIMNTHANTSLTNVLEKCQALPLEEQMTLLGLCLRNLDNGKTIGYEGPNDNKMHDISLVSGRSAWLASKMLNKELSPINARTSKREAAEVRGAILQAISDKRWEIAYSTYASIKCLLSDKLRLAESNSTKRELLVILAEDPDISVRKAVATNPKTPVATLVKLSKSDPDAEVREIARKNSEIIREFRLPKKAHKADLYQPANINSNNLETPQQ